MVIEQKAIIGKLNKFPSRIQHLFALGNSFRSCQQTKDLFRPFGCMVNTNGNLVQERNDKSNVKGEINTRPLSQTYPQWKVMCDVAKLHSLHKRKRFKNRILYILPLGTVDEKETVGRLINEYNQENGLPNYCSNLLHFVMKYMPLFFYGMEVKLLTFQDINSLGFTMRVHPRTNRKQVLVTDILDYLNKVRPSDSFCIIGWSSLDLYPSSELNFVLGEANFDTGCAVISFGDYADIVTEEGVGKHSETVLRDDLANLSERSCTSVASCLSSDQHDEYPRWDCTNLDDKVVWRVLKVLTHEVCHLVGMHHCTFFACLMNESSNVSEAQNQPLFLCPVCLRKLHKFLKFTIVSRYQMLKDFLELHCGIFATRQLTAHCQTAGTTDCNDLSKHINGMAAEPEDKTTYTLQKFTTSSKWLDRVLMFINNA